MKKIPLEERLVTLVLDRAAEYAASAPAGKQRIYRELVDELRKALADAPGIKALRSILQRLRWDDQGGYPSRRNGKWDFVSTGLPQTKPQELDLLFSLAGIVPDEIESLGSCSECSNAQVGNDGARYERGYVRPCLDCQRPRMSNFVPLHMVVR